MLLALKSTSTQRITDQALPLGFCTDIGLSYILSIEINFGFDVGTIWSTLDFILWSCWRHSCYSTVTCKVFIESTPSSLNRPQRKLGQSCAKSWNKIDRHANKRHACIALLYATLTPLKQIAGKLPVKSTSPAPRVRSSPENIGPRI